MAGMKAEYESPGPRREEVDRIQEPLVLEFGTQWCGWCHAAQTHIAEALQAHPNVRHIKVEDGPGRPLGRSFRVKLWPTLVFLKDGAEIARVVRPGSAEPLAEALEKITSPSTA